MAGVVISGRRFFVFWSDVNFIRLRRGPPEVANSPAKAAANFGQFVRAKKQKNNYQYEQQLLHANAKHAASLRYGLG